MHGSGSGLDCLTDVQVGPFASGHEDMGIDVEAPLVIEAEVFQDIPTEDQLLLGVPPYDAESLEEPRADFRSGVIGVSIGPLDQVTWKGTESSIPHLVEVIKDQLPKRNSGVRST
jgi:hypothetical protein